MSYISVKDQLNYIDVLFQFPLGQILLNKGLIDTFWTDFIMTNDERCNNDLEDFLLTRSPFTLSWRELLHNFKKNIQACLKNEMILASIPCGAMRELLELDYSQVSNFKIIGIDIDTDSLSLAQKLAEEKGLHQNLSLLQQDAWQLQYKSEIDLITSCGLNIYISDREKVLNLYRQFFKALKPDGILIIGFLTYPPDEKMPSEWCIDHIPPEDLLLEKILYKDILDVQWRNFRTSDEFKNELKEVGFSAVSFHYDKLHVFPVVVAKK
ncbi:MAG: class I SAM-dependent methyltransferase [Rhabdochlamydiaceae bacterium]